MRSPIGPVLVLLGLATTVVLVLLLFQTMSVRSDLEATRAQLGAIEAEVAAQEEAITDEDLVQRLDDLEAGIRDWLISTGADGGFDGTPAGGGAGETGTSTQEVLERVDEILERIETLDNRIDEICEGVPVC